MIINENLKVPKSETIQEYQKRIKEKHYDGYKLKIICRIKLTISDNDNANQIKYSINKKPTMYMFIEGNFDRLEKDLKNEGLSLQYKEDHIVKYKGVFKKVEYTEIVDQYYLIAW